MAHKCPLEVGKKYGRWAWLGEPPERREGGYYYYPLTCECGAEKWVAVANVIKGKSNSCGCLNAELLSARATHGKRLDPIYPVWNMMVQRCHNPAYRRYADYGGRGIKVCSKWRKFEGFYADMGDPPFKGAMLERVNNDKNYTKSNCIWADRKTQNRNKRNILVVKYRGKLQKFLDLVDPDSSRYFKVYQRIHTYGWSVERAVDTP